MTMNVVFQQILVIFGYVAVGCIAGKIKLINDTERKFLSRLITSVTLPFTILAASNYKAGSGDVANMLLSMIIMLLFFAATTAVSLFICTKRNISESKKVVYTGLCTYPNNAFIGMPICIALMGELGTLYGAASMIAFNVLFFTVQVSLFTRQKFSFKLFITPLNISTMILILMLVFHISFPAPLQIICTNIGGITTPLALIIVGVMLADSNFAEVLKDKRSYFITIIRNFVCPAVMLAILVFLPLDTSMRLAILIFVACPVGNMTSVYAIQTDMEPGFCARATILSTVVFAASLPLIISLGERLL